MKIIAMSASLRTGSYNRMLLKNAEAALKQEGAEVTVIDLRDFLLPYYDGDIEESTGAPELAQKLSALILQHDALVLATPEYNHSFPGHFKNTVDWLSRLDPVPFENKPTLLLSTSPGLAAGSRATWAIRVPFELLGAYVYPEAMNVPKAPSQFAADGSFTDAKNPGRMASLVKGFLDFAGKLNR